MQGEKIISYIKNFKDYGITVNYYENNGKVNLYALNGKNYRVKVNVDPKKWLGLEFYLLDKNGKTLLTYDIDTDLYDISLPKYHSFADKIELDIVEFLNSLSQGKIKIGKIKGKPAMIMPMGNRFLLVKKGWFFTSGKYYNDVNDINLDEISIL